MDFPTRLLGFILSLLLVPLAGFVFSQGWLWFVVPLNAHIPVLSVFHAAGIMLMVSMMQGSLALSISEIREAAGLDDNVAMIDVFFKKMVIAIAYLIVWGFMWIYAGLA